MGRYPRTQHEGKTLRPAQPHVLKPDPQADSADSALRSLALQLAAEAKGHYPKSRQVAMSEKI